MTWGFARPAEGRWLGGVCAGVAQACGWSPRLVRVLAGVLLLATGPAVVLAYLAAWAFLPDGAASDGDSGVPGRRAAGPATGERPSPGPPPEALATVAVAVGGVLLLSEILSWLPRGLVGPVLLAGAGAALAWGRGRATGSAESLRALRVAVGVSLALFGAGLTLAAVSDLRTIGRSAAGAAVVVTGIALMLGPGLARLGRTLTEERRQRIRSEERAEVAAHLHDGVLQTLALIQRQPGANREVRSLARRQERELREWLYGTPDPVEPDTVAALLRRELAEVEDRYGVRLDAVLVGDAPLDEAGRALVAAGQEAVRNAARHSGVDAVDVYLEVEPERCSLFVRDRGRGFDPAHVPPDRRGIADSVRGRLRRVGGAAEVRSAPGEGAEVELWVPRAGAGR